MPEDTTIATLPITSQALEQIEAIASDEGWSLFQGDDRHVRIVSEDSAKLVSHDAAHAFVAFRASNGSALHALALLLHNRLENEPQPTVTVSLSVDVTYLANGTDPQALRAALERAVSDALDRGTLAGDTPAEPLFVATESWLV